MMHATFRYILLCLFFGIFPITSMAKPLVADISSRSVQIDSGFTGTELLLFGARNDPGDIVVVLRGPYGSYMVRKKERVAGIWVNRKQVQFDDIEGFYAVASSKPLGNFRNSYLLESLGIGIDQLQSSIKSKATLHRKADRDGEFSYALLTHKQKNQLYPTDVSDVSFIGETLFRTLIPIPENIPRGMYIAEIYLLSDGQLSGIQSTPLIVKKTGFDAFIYDLAYQHSFLYGVLAIIVALGAGWLAGIIFRKV